MSHRGRGPAAGLLGVAAVLAAAALLGGCGGDEDAGSAPTPLPRLTGAAPAPAVPSPSAPATPSALAQESVAPDDPARPSGPAAPPDPAEPTRPAPSEDPGPAAPSDQPGLSGPEAFVLGVRAELPEVAAGRTGEQIARIAAVACRDLAAGVPAAQIESAARSLGSLDAEAVDPATARQLVRLAIDTACLDQAPRVDEF